jgi:CRISPR/Cas system-associated exonuclease Cas4 (RecB family)
MSTRARDRLAVLGYALALAAATALLVTVWPA